MSGEAYGQPFPVEVLWTCELSLHDGRHSGAHLPGSDSFRQIVQQSCVGQGVQMSGPVGY